MTLKSPRGSISSSHSSLSNHQYNKKKQEVTGARGMLETEPCEPIPKKKGDSELEEFLALEKHCELEGEEETFCGLTQGESRDGRVGGGGGHPIFMSLPVTNARTSPRSNALIQNSPTFSQYRNQNKGGIFFGAMEKTTEANKDPST